MENSFKIFTNGLSTGLFLQLAVGPVFFYIINLALQGTLYDGLVAVFAVTLVDYFYIILSVMGIGKFLEVSKAKKTFGIVSSIVLIVFGFIIIKGVLNSEYSTVIKIVSKDLSSSFFTALILTITNPLTIIFFTSLFTTKSIEYNYTRKNLYIFGFSVGLATIVFMSASVILFSLVKGVIPVIVIRILNLFVGFVLICYGSMRIIRTLNLKILRKETNENR
jgi:threonine/homoserine/homoserine lactone efflux protein